MKNPVKAHIYIKRFIECILTITLCFFITQTLNYIYVNDCTSWERTVMKEFYTQKDNIDCIYLGSSHVFMGVIPTRMDNINGRNNFNLSTPAQSYMTSYYLLNEALKRNDLEHVYLEMYYMIPYTRGNLDDADVMSTNWDILYQMSPSFNKLNYMCHLLNKKYGMMTLFPVRRFSNHVFDAEYIKSNLNYKKTEDYKNVIYVPDEQAPRFEKGFCTTLEHMEPGTFEGNTSAIPGVMVAGNSEEYLRKIINLCQKEGIGLTLFTSPMPDFRLCCMGNYDDYIEEINEIAEKYGLHYYDFNLCNIKYLDLQNDKYIMNYDHQSYEGAILFSDVLGEVLLDELEGNPIPEDMFYSSYDEKMQQIDQRIFGLDIQQDNAQEIKTYMLYSVDNLAETEAEFRVTKIRTGESQAITVQEWSTQNCVTFPETETGVFIVEARPVGSEEITNRVETEY